MFLSTHTLSGIALASAIHEPLVSLPISFGSHFVLDSLPHLNTTRKLARKSQILLALGDLSAALIISYMIYLFSGNAVWLVAGFVAMLPDVDVLLHHVVYPRYTNMPILLPRSFSSFHSKIQNETTNYKVLLLEFFIIVLSLGVIYARIA